MFLRGYYRFLFTYREEEAFKGWGCFHSADWIGHYVKSLLSLWSSNLSSGVSGTMSVRNMKMSLVMSGVMYTIRRLQLLDQFFMGEKKGVSSLIHLCFKCVWTLSGIYETNHKRSSEIETPLERTGSLYYLLWHQIKQHGGGKNLSVTFLAVSNKSTLTKLQKLTVYKLQVSQDIAVQCMLPKTNRCPSTVLQWACAGKQQYLLHSATQHGIKWMCLTLLVYWLSCNKVRESTHKGKEGQTQGALWPHFPLQFRVKFSPGVGLGSETRARAIAESWLWAWIRSWFWH